MATYWLAPDGNDANDGLSYANRKLTWAAALQAAETAGAGNTVNIVAPSAGPLTIADAGGITLNGLGGTNYDSAPGMRIKGTDSSGTAAMAYIRFQDSATSVTALTLSTGANYIDIQGLNVDWSANSTAANSKHFIQVTSTAANGLRVRDCVFKWGSTVRGQCLSFQVNSSDDCVFRYNVFIATDGVAASNPAPFTFDDRGQLDCDHNIFIFGGAIAGNMSIVNLGNNDANLTDHDVSNNTFYIPTGMTVSGTLTLINSTDASPFAATPRKRVKDNVLYWQDSASDMTWMEGNSSTPASWIIDIGYNQLHYLSGNGWSGNHPYEMPWDSAGTEQTPPETTSWTGDNKVAADPFNNLAATYAWGMSGNGYSYTLPYDLRIATAYRTTSSVGGVPGAIIDAIAASAPEINVASTLTINGNVLVPVTETLVIYNTGDAALTISSATFAADAGATLAYNGSASYSIPAGSSQAVTFTFTPTSGGTVTGTFTIVSNDSDEPSVAVTIRGVTPTSWTIQPGLPSNPVSVNNPAVINSPRHRDRGIKVAMNIRKNLAYEWNFVTSVGGFSDTVTNLKVGSVSLATNTELTAIAGLSLSNFNKLMVMVKGGNSVLQAGSQTFLLKDGGCVLLANVSGMSSILLSNPSLINRVDVHIFAAGGTLVTSNPRGVRDSAQELDTGP